MKSGLKLALLTILMFPNCISAQKTMSDEREQAIKLIELAGIQRTISGFSNIRSLTPHLELSAEMVDVVAISFEGPYDGYLVLLDQSDSVLDVKRTGFIKSISLNSFKSNRDFIICDVIQGTGTGVRVDNYLILFVQDNRLNYSWMEKSYEKSAAGRLDTNANYEIKTSLEFDDINNDRLLDIICHYKRIEYDSTFKEIKLERTHETIFTMNWDSQTFEEMPSYSKNPLVMPRELVELAEKHGFKQFDEFYSRVEGQEYPPYVYGYKKNLLFYNSVAFWVKQSEDEDSAKVKFHLVFAERTDNTFLLRITDIIPWSNPMGLTLYEDTSAELSDFFYFDDPETTGPELVKLRDCAVESYYDGNYTVFYLHEGKVFVRTFNDW